MRAAISLTAITLLGLLAVAPAQAANSIAVTAGAAIEGSFGLHVTLDGTSTDAYVRSDHPTDEKTFTARFWVEPNALGSLTGGNSIRFLIASTEGCCQQVIGFISKSAGTGNFRIITWLRNDGGTFQLGGNTFLTSGATPVAAQVEITWTAATAPAANNGSIFVSVNGGTPNGRSDIDNDTLEVDSVRVGAHVGGNPSAASGSWDFDSYESFR